MLMAVESKGRQAVPVRVKDTPHRVDLPGSSDNLDLSTMGGRIAWARMRKDLTQDHLSNVIDKSRATVVQYEKNRIEPPLSVVNKLAAALDISASYIAFGEHGVVTATPDGPNEMLTVPEITFGRDGEYTSSNLALPRRMVEGFSQTTRDVKVYVLNHDAPAFNYSSGDRLFCDTSVKSANSNREMYLVRSGAGMQIVRLEPTIGSKRKTLIFTGPKGQKIEVEEKDLEVIGAVVGVIKTG